MVWAVVVSELLLSTNIATAPFLFPVLIPIHS